MEARSWLFEALYRSPRAYKVASELGFRGYWRLWQRLALRHVPRGLLLDVGCGLGDLAREAAASGWTAIGLDRSRQMVDAARRQRAHAPNARPAFVIADAHALPIADGGADAVTMTFPSHVVLERALALEVRRALKPGGRAAIVLGATLRPTSATSTALLLAHRIAYGPGAGIAPAQAPWLPFEAVGLRQSYLVVERPHWAAWLVVLTKPD